MFKHGHICALFHDKKCNFSFLLHINGIYYKYIYTYVILVFLYKAFYTKLNISTNFLVSFASFWGEY